MNLRELLLQTLILLRISFLSLRNYL